MAKDRSKAYQIRVSKILSLLPNNSITEAALRKRAITQNLPIQRFPTTALLNHSYSSGEISMTEFDLLQNCLKIREKVAHGVMTPIDPEILKLAQSTIQSLIKQWRTDSF